MSTFLSLFYCAMGIVALVLGGDWLVRGAVDIAARMRVPPLVVGLTVVAFGTSAPELAVSIIAALNGSAGVAIGNVVGSNIFNIMFIAGLSSLIAPLSVDRQLLKVDVPIMILASLLVWWLLSDGLISQSNGVILFAGIIGYVILCVVISLRASRQGRVVDTDAVEVEVSKVPVMWKSSLWLVVGLLALTIGSRLLVDGATRIAVAMGISELVIGLTIVAVGTSLPEVAASVAASLKGQREIALGNVVGSNIFNIGCVLGVSSLISGGGIPVSEAALRLDIPVMVVTAVVTLPICLTGRMVSRREGAALMAGYVGYVGVLIWQAV